MNKRLTTCIAVTILTAIATPAFGRLPLPPEAETVLSDAYQGKSYSPYAGRGFPLASGGAVAQAPGDACTALDPNAAILSSGFGLDPSNTRNVVSSITASNIDRLRLRFALGGPVQEKRGAPAVTEQALFYYIGNQVVAAARSTGCTFWTTTLTDSARGAADPNLRSSSHSTRSTVM